MNTSRTKITKKILVYVSLFLFVAGAINLYLANVVSVTSNMPKAVRPGAVIPVTVTIDKGQVEGFGRFTCTLPKDFVATSTNQNFSFTDNTITVLWVKLPQSSSFSFNFNIIVPEKTKSSFNFSAKFGYVENNEKRFAELKPQNVRVTGTADEIPLENNDTKRISESTGKSDDLFEVGSFDDGSDYAVTQTTETKTEYVSSKNNPDLINNILSSNSAKPTMTSIDAEPSKIVQTTTTTSTTTTTTTITPIAETPKAEVTEEKRLETKTSPAPTNTVKTAQTTTKAAPTLSNKNVELKTKNNTVNNTVSYRVQLAATHRKIKNSKNFFEKRNITENVVVEKNGTWFKYTTQQSSKTYQDARNQRNTIWEQTPIKGAFVVAYNGKKRITVQEALMLSNQKWVK